MSVWAHSYVQQWKVHRSYLTSYSKHNGGATLLAQAIINIIIITTTTNIYIFFFPER